MLLGIGASPASAITGGEEATEPYAFMGSLQRIDGPRDDRHVCGVSLIAPTWAVTAGHCTRSAADVLDRPTTGSPLDWQVRFGSLDVGSGGQLVDVARFVQLNNRYFRDDLALLELAEPVVGEPIEIAADEPAAGAPTRILGWGMTCDDSSDPACLPTRLQQADTEIRPDDTCRPNDEDLCIGSLDGDIGPANMDSGGPAIVRSDGQWMLVGSVEGGGGSEPGYFTSVPAHRDWIDGFVSGTVQIPADTPFPSDALEGTVQVGPCSGAVIASSRTEPSDPAMVLTNGHCAEPRPQPGGAQIDQQIPIDVFVHNANGQPVVRASTARLLYATITETDVAVFSLDVTYEQLSVEGVDPFTLAPDGPQPGQDLQVLSGLSGKDWACEVDAVVPRLEEAGYVQRDAVRYQRETACGAGGLDGPGAGDSGSPLTASGGREILAVHSTGNDGGDRCTEDNACEVNEDGEPTTVTGAKYAQQTAALDDCLVAGSRFDPAIAGCELPGSEGYDSTLALPTRTRVLGPLTAEQVAWALVAAGGGATIFGVVMLVRRSRRRAATTSG